MNAYEFFPQQLLFNPPSNTKPFSKGVSYGNQGNQEFDLYIDCFVSCFRITPHNNDVLKVCLNPQSPPMYHYVLVNALHKIITQPRLKWWPKISIIYNKAGELRTMFNDVVNRVTQGFSSHNCPKQTIPKLANTFKMTKATDETLSSYKLILLWLVKLIHADPLLLLHVSLNYLF